jgi:hypothetical protein
MIRQTERDGSAFWEQAWALSAYLDNTVPADAVAESLAPLVTNLTIQRYVFDHLQWHDASWFATLREFELFQSPPEPVVTEQGTSTTAWPVMAYLKAVVAVEPTF